MQLDMLAQTLTPEERDHVDERKFVEQRLAVRDMTSLLVPEAEAKQRKEARSQQMAQVEQVQMAQAEAERRKTLADALKGVSQAQKNTAAADAQSATATLDILERGSQIGNESGQSDKSKSARS